MKDKTYKCKESTGCQSTHVVQILWLSRLNFRGYLSRLIIKEIDRLVFAQPAFYLSGFKTFQSHDKYNSLGLLYAVAPRKSAKDLRGQHTQVR